MLWNSLVNSGSRSWIRKRLPFRIPSTASVARRPTWLIHKPFAHEAMLVISTPRVAKSMKNKTRQRVSPLCVQTSTVKKSAATIKSQCRLRNSFQVVFRFRSGAGSIPRRRKTAETVLRAHSCPKLASALAAYGNPVAILLRHANHQRCTTNSNGFRSLFTVWRFSHHRLDYRDPTDSGFRTIRGLRWWRKRGREEQLIAFVLVRRSR
jgi:hypothetical protein